MFPEKEKDIYKTPKWWKDDKERKRLSKLHTEPELDYSFLYALAFGLFVSGVVGIGVVLDKRFNQEDTVVLQTPTNEKCPKNNGITITTGPLYDNKGRLLPKIETTIFSNSEKK